MPLTTLLLSLMTGLINYSVMGVVLLSLRKFLNNVNIFTCKQVTLAQKKGANFPPHR